MSDPPTDTPRQLDRLQEVDWDRLLILDATRWDVWDEMMGVGEKVWSPGNCTPEWIRAAHRALDFSDTVCITANPEVTRNTFDDLYAYRDDLWERQWQLINGIGTVPPEKVTGSVEAAGIVGPDRSIYAHYAQPHGPYPMSDPPIPVMRNNPEADEVDLDNDDFPNEIIMNPTNLLDDPDSWLTEDMLREAYRTNLQWAWDAIQPLLEGDETVVVTADHGEILGEKVETATGGTLRYGHPAGDPHPLLREVPFAVFD